MPYLIYAPETVDEKIYELKLGVNTIGRRESNRIFVMDDTLSRKHAEITIAGPQVTIADRGSRNGTQVNNVKIDQCELKDGDLIRCGEVVFKFVEVIEDSQISIVKEVSLEPTRIVLQELLEPDGVADSVIRLPQQDAAQRTADKLKILLEVSKQLSSPDETERLLEKILKLLFEIMKVERAAILMVNQETKQLELKAVKSQLPSQGNYLYSKTITDKVRSSGNAILTKDARCEIGSESAIEQKIRAAMCVPLKSQEEVMGVLYVDHISMSGSYSDEDVEFLAALANQAALAIENAILQESKRQSALARYELDKGQQMQKEFLPEQLPQISGWNIAAFFEPARQVAGDFYDAFLLPNGHVGLVIGDVCDKGVASALFMALFRSLIRVFSGQTQLSELAILTDDSSVRPKTETNSAHIKALKAVELTNNYVAQNHSEIIMFVTLFFGILEPATGLLSYINGGHVPLVILNPQGVKERLEPTGMAVGALPNQKFEIKQTYLEPGDILFGYTDGVTDAKSPTGEKFTTEKLLSLLNQYSDSAEALLDGIRGIVMSHIDEAVQFDDITMLAVRRKS